MMVILVCGDCAKHLTSLQTLSPPDLCTTTPTAGAAGRQDPTVVAAVGLQAIILPGDPLAHHVAIVHQRFLLHAVAQAAQDLAVERRLAERLLLAETLLFHTQCLPLRQKYGRTCPWNG